MVGGVKRATAKAASPLANFSIGKGGAAAVGVGATLGAASEMLNPDGAIGDISQTLTGRRDAARQSLRWCRPWCS